MIHLNHMVWAEGVTTGTNTLCKSPETIISPYVFQPSTMNHSEGSLANLANQYICTVCTYMLVWMILLDIFVAMFSVLGKELCSDEIFLTSARKFVECG